MDEGRGGEREARTGGKRGDGGERTGRESVCLKRRENPWLEERV